MGFLDKVNDISKMVGQKATETYKTVSDKSGKIIEETKIKLKINDKESKIQELYSELGQKIYSLYSDNGEVGDYKIECDQIAAIKTEIVELGIKVKHLKGIRTCDSCQKEIKVNYKFCPLCGATQEPIEDEIQVDIIEEPLNQKINIIVCESCNNELPEDAEFCPFCGEKIVK